MFDDQVTVLIPTSPIPRHPDTALIEECIGSIRSYFPDARVVIMADGVRPQIENRRSQYEHYKKRLSERLPLLGRCELAVCPEYTQQCEMTREILKTVSTPNILFVEHDAILRKDPPLAFAPIFEMLGTGEANLVRFYNWQDIWHEHVPMMHGELKKEGARFVKTTQYSQWPLVSRTDYHRRLLASYCAPGRRAMIETVMYGPVAAAPWDANRIFIYLDGGFAFTHRDGRTDESTGRRDPSEW